MIEKRAYFQIGLGRQARPTLRVCMLGWASYVALLLGMNIFVSFPFINEILFIAKKKIRKNREMGVVEESSLLGKQQDTRKPGK